MNDKQFIATLKALVNAKYPSVRYSPLDRMEQARFRQSSVEQKKFEYRRELAYKLIDEGYRGKVPHSYLYSAV